MLPYAGALPKATPRSVTYGTLPAFVDESQPPQKRQPFGSLLRQRCVNSLDLIFPDELAEDVRKRLADIDGKIRYAKVIMSLGDILSGDFFTQYVKSGNVMMMSEGRRRLDTRFEMFDGVLRIEVDKATYERAGLAGTAISDGGSKHSKNRYAIELDLRLPSMLHGKKGFERIKWACRNVFDQSLNWLFCDNAPRPSADSVSCPIDKHHPRWFTVQSIASHVSNIRVPTLTGSGPSSPSETVCADGYLMSDLEEWINLLFMKSPRIQFGDRPNNFVCRYTCPTDGLVGTQKELDRMTTVTDLTGFSWKGFIPSYFVLQTLLAVKKASKDRGWWVIKSRGMRLDNDVVTLLQRSRHKEDPLEFLCWHNST